MKLLFALLGWLVSLTLFLLCAVFCVFGFYALNTGLDTGLSYPFPIALFCFILGLASNPLFLRHAPLGQRPVSKFLSVTWLIIAGGIVCAGGAALEMRFDLQKRDGRLTSLAQRAMHMDGSQDAKLALNAVAGSRHPLDRPETKYYLYYASQMLDTPTKAAQGLVSETSNLVSDKDAEAYLMASATAGYAPAEVQFCAKGGGDALIKIDDVTATAWCLKAAKQNYAPALRQLGDNNLDPKSNGFSAIPDLQKAVLWYEKAAGLGDSTAVWQLYRLYADDQSPLKDEAKANLWLEKGAQLNDRSSQFQLAEASREARDYPKAIKWYSAVADSTDDGVDGGALANFYLGVFQKSGIGVPIDESHASSRFEKAIHIWKTTTSGAQDMYDAGMSLFSGKDLPQDDEWAGRLMSEAAHKGLFSAEWKLGDMYRRGYGGVDVDRKLALQWLQKAGIDGADDRADISAVQGAAP